MKGSVADPVLWVANFIIHETVHHCGKVGHDPPDNPYDWAELLTNPRYDPEIGLKPKKLETGAVNGDASATKAKVPTVPKPLSG